MNTHGVPRASATNLQQAIVQDTLVHAAELTWSGREGMEGEYQAAIKTAWDELPSVPFSCSEPVADPGHPWMAWYP